MSEKTVENCGSASGKWIELERIHSETGAPAHPWTKGAARMWDEHLRTLVGCDIEAFIKSVAEDRCPILAYSIYVFFPADFDMSGHLCFVRKVRDNMSIFNYAHYRAHKNQIVAVEYHGTGFVAIRSKYILRKLAEESPLFVPIWKDLKDLSPDDCGIYLAGAPDADWLASIQPNEHRLFDAFKNGYGLAMAGMESVETSKDALRCLAIFESIQSNKPFKDVKESFEKIVSSTPCLWEFWNSYALYLLQHQIADLAYDIVGVARKMYPDCLMLDRLAALCCIELEDWDRAERHIKRFWGVNPWDPFILLGYARVAYKKQEYLLSAKLYGEYMEYGHWDYSDMQKYAISLANLHRYEEALSVYYRMESDYGPRAALLNNIGMALAGLGRLQEAAAYCLRALELDSTYSAAWDSLGFTYLMMGHYDDAIPALLKAIELEPNYSDAWRHILHAYHNSGKDEKLSGARALVADILPDELARFEREKGGILLD